MKSAFSLCVYCGARPGNNPVFIETARTVGRWIGQHQGQLVYGGGKAGLMGQVAQATAQAGGRVVGIIPKALVEKEYAKADCDELHIVDTMHERKRLMAEQSDAFLALPGGIGTLEELFEIWTWRQLGFHDKPIGVLNTENYFDGLLGFLTSAVQHEFLSDWQSALITISQDPQGLLKQLVQDAGLTPAPSLDRI